MVDIINFTLKNGGVMKKIGYAVLVLLFAWFVSGCVESGPKPVQEKVKPAAASGSVMYNKYNIHVHYKSPMDIKAHCANWTGPFPGHQIVPPNTPMTVKVWPRGLILKRTDNGETINLTFSSKFMNMDSATYIDTIFSPKKVSLAHFSTVDKKGIENGSVIKGMTKEGIKTALGYPAAHKTPSLDDNEWMYWTNRFGTFAVLFDQNGIVTGIRD